MLLIVAHALRHVHREHAEVKLAAGPASPPAPLIATPELLDALRALLAQTTVSEEATRLYTLPSPHAEREANTGEQQENIAQDGDELRVNNYERVKAYLAGHPDAKVRDVAEALTISLSTASNMPQVASTSSGVATSPCDVRMCSDNVARPPSSPSRRR